MTQIGRSVAAAFAASTARNPLDLLRGSAAALLLFKEYRDEPPRHDDAASEYRAGGILVQLGPHRAAGARNRVCRQKSKALSGVRPGLDADASSSCRSIAFLLDAGKSPSHLFFIAAAAVEVPRHAAPLSPDRALRATAAADGRVRPRRATVECQSFFSGRQLCFQRKRSERR